MKKTVVMMLLLFPLSLSAQLEKRHQLSVSTSVGSSPASSRLADMRDDVIARYGWNLDDNDQINLGGTSHWMINFAYHYRLTSRWAVGVMAGWGRGSYSYQDWEVTPTIVLIPDIETKAKAWFESRLFYAAPSVRYQWHQSRKGTVRWYSGVSVGMYRQHLECNVSVPGGEPGVDHIKWGMSYQVTPVGFEMGTHKWMLFGEVGIGYQNNVALGLRYGL